MQRTHKSAPPIRRAKRPQFIEQCGAPLRPRYADTTIVGGGNPRPAIERAYLEPGIVCQYVRYNPGLTQLCMQCPRL